MTDSDRQRRSAASRAYKTVNARYCIDGADFFPSTPSKQRPHVTGSRPGCHVSGSRRAARRAEVAASLLGSRRRAT